MVFIFMLKPYDSKSAFRFLNDKTRHIARLSKYCTQFYEFYTQDDYP